MMNVLPEGYSYAYTWHNPGVVAELFKYHSIAIPVYRRQGGQDHIVWARWDELNRVWEVL